MSDLCVSCVSVAVDRAVCVLHHGGAQCVVSMSSSLLGGASERAGCRYCLRLVELAHDAEVLEGCRRHAYIAIRSIGEGTPDGACHS